MLQQSDWRGDGSSNKKNKKSLQEIMNYQVQEEGY